MKNNTVLALTALLITACSPAHAANLTKRDFFHPDQGFYVRGDVAALAYTGTNAYTCYGGLAAVGVRFAESDDFYHGVEFRTGALLGGFTESGAFKVGSQNFKYSGKSENTAIPVLTEYSLAYRVTEDLSVFGAAGGGVLFSQQTIKDAKVTGVNITGNPSVSGLAPVAMIGAGIRYTLSRHVEAEVGYRFTHVFSYDREGSARVGSATYDISARAEAANAHVFYAGLAWKF